jgi:hypothetical protein
MPPLGEQGQPNDSAGGQHDDIVRDAELTQTDAKSGSNNSEAGKEHLRSDKPTKKFPEVFASKLVKEKAEWNEYRACDAPVHVLPKRDRLVKKRAKELPVCQQADTVENTTRGKVNQREVARFATKEKERDCHESDT